MLRAIVASLLLASAVGAAPTPTDAGPDKDASPAAKLKKQLDQNINLEVNDQTLTAALNQIRELTKINFVVDRQFIQQTGIDPEQLIVSVKLKDVKVRTALRSILAPHNLGYAILGDSVLVSTDDMAIFRQLRQRVNIDLDKVPLPEALKKLSKDTAANVLLDPRVLEKEGKSTVTLQLEDVQLETGVRLMVEMAGLKPVKVGNVLFVTRKAWANELRAEVDPNMQGQPQPQPPPDGPVLPVPPPVPGGPPPVTVPVPPDPMPSVDPLESPLSKVKPPPAEKIEPLPKQDKDPDQPSPKE